MTKLKKGFTLIEVSVAIGIISALSGFIAPKLIKEVKKTHMAKVESRLYDSGTLIVTKSDSGYPTLAELKGNLGKYHIKDTLGFTDDDGIKHKNSHNIISLAFSLRSSSYVGGWIYDKNTGKLYANLPDGAYTGDSKFEVWDHGNRNPSPTIAINQVPQKSSFQKLPPSSLQGLVATGSNQQQFPPIQHHSITGHYAGKTITGQALPPQPVVGQAGKTITGQALPPQSVVAQAGPTITGQALPPQPVVHHITGAPATLDVDPTKRESSDTFKYFKSMATGFGSSIYSSPTGKGNLRGAGVWYFSADAIPGISQGSKLTGDCYVYADGVLVSHVKNPNTQGGTSCKLGDYPLTIGGGHTSVVVSFAYTDGATNTVKYFYNLVS